MIRLMTYNIRACRGLDGKVSPERIAGIINSYKPDVVALQEVDVNRERTGGIDQARVLAGLTGMNYHFYARLKEGQGEYGIALMTPHPVTIKKTGNLPLVIPSEESTGAIWAEILIKDKTINVFTTHFKHNLKEREVQAEALMGPGWLNHAQTMQNIILMADFNSRWISNVYKSFRENLFDVQLDPSVPRIKKTWPSFLPFMRIDHIFISDDFKVKKVKTGGGINMKIASDHLPLMADVEFT